MDNEKNFPVPEELIVQNIYLIRGKKVMLDTDLAALYGVSTRDLNKAVKRNILRFPNDFMFKLDKSEFENLKFHFGTSRWGGTRKLPNAFTEPGIAMLSGILHSRQAIIVNIHIIRVFIKIREMMTSHKEILEKLEELEKNDLEHERKIILIFNYLNQLEESRKNEIEFKERRRIGFKPD